MIGSLTFTRDDGETFTFSAVNPPYQLTPDTLLPAGLALDVSGGEYTGRNGGYTLAGRLQRRTAKIVYNVRETYSDARSMMQLLNDAAGFFRPMTADLRIVSFDMLVQTDDGDKSAYIMRRGHVTTPFTAPLLRGGHGSYAAEFDLIFDDPLLYWADGSGVVSGDILPAALPGSKVGETWVEGLQVWAAGLSRWEYPDQGGGGTPQTVNVVSAYQVPVAFTITGQITNPKIVNSRNGSQWSWEGTIPYGCVVTVDVDGVALDWQGNRLLNTMGGLVAAPGDNTFTLTGSDLVLDVKAAWTGTPNASTSTLSQDGQVVATNIIPCPGTMKLGPWGNPLNFRQSGSGTCENISLPDCPMPITTGIHISGTSKVGACIDDKTLDPGDYVFAVWAKVPVGKGIMLQIDWDKTNLVDHGNATFQGDGNWHRYTVTGQIVAATVSYAYAYSSGGGADSYFAAPFFCTATDWQAMQALGVDWFDGDSMFNIVTAKASVQVRGAF